MEDRRDEEAGPDEVAEVAPPQGLTQEEFNAWISIDKEVEVSQELTNENFTASLVEHLVAGPQNEEEEADSDDDGAKEPPPKVTAADMRRSLQQLQQGLLQTDFGGMDSFYSLKRTLEDHLREAFPPDNTKLLTNGCKLIDNCCDDDLMAQKLNDFVFLLCKPNKMQ